MEIHGKYEHVSKDLSYTLTKHIFRNRELNERITSNTVNLYSQLIYSTWRFQALQIIVLAVFGVAD